MPLELEPDALWQAGAGERASAHVIHHRDGACLSRDAHGERRFAADDWAEVEAWLRS